MTEKQKIKFLVKKLAQKRIYSSENFLKLKQKLAAQLFIPLPGNVDLLNIYKKMRKTKKIKIHPYFEKHLRKRPVRSLSGVAVVAVLTKPWPCPGQCLYCPIEKGIPKSYLSGEPAVERAKLLKYNPFQQVKKRIAALEKIGHPADKIELIVIGGTWSYLPEQYQTWFIKKCFDGANSTNSKNLSLAQKKNEKAKHRIVGLTLETRPDYITPAEILRMRRLGCTRVEIGIQIIDNKILEKNKRGHGVKEIIKATTLLKNAGFKICYHIMPGLPGSSPRKDLTLFKKLFSDQNFQPDMLKIYPCVVTKGAPLYKLWKKGKYQPYSDKQLVKLLIKMKSVVPPYVRINRVIRDIPAWQIKGGSKISNLREIVQKEMKRQGLKCCCIRCREIKSASWQIKIKSLKLIRRNYQASGGKEVFLSYKNTKQDKLAAFLRLRLLPHPIWGTIPMSIIREVHTYGQLVSIGKKSKATQHLGLGKKLIRQAENISKNSGYKKIAVISGIGTHEYYRKLGYHLKKTYLVKKLNIN